MIWYLRMLPSTVSIIFIKRYPAEPNTTAHKPAPSAFQKKNIRAGSFDIPKLKGITCRKPYMNLMKKESLIGFLWIMSVGLLIIFLMKANLLSKLTPYPLPK